MKKKLYLFTLTLIASVCFTASTANAQNWSHNHDYSTGPWNNGNGNGNSHNNNGHNNHGGTNNGNPGTSTNLPINNGIAFLFIGGLAIGIVTLKRSKSLTPAVTGE